MITETMRHELKGKWIRCVIEDGNCFLTAGVEHLPVEGDGQVMTFKEAAKAVDELAEELREIRERLDDLGGIPIEPKPTVIFDDLYALNSGHAREEALKRFYGLEANRELVLTVTNCEPLTHNKTGENAYRIVGWTRPRVKRLRDSLLPKTEGVTA